MIALLLVAFADLVAPQTPPAAGEVQVNLELGYGTYKIDHFWHGKTPMRFVTGASQRNCDSPVDVLLVDDKPLALSSELPCGGFAFRAVQTIAPGGNWTIEGHVTLPPGSHEVHALYATAPEALKAIDPKERAKREPPFWLGRAVSSELLVDEVIKATQRTPNLDPKAFADLKQVDATSLHEDERVVLGRVIKPALRDNPHALVRLLVESGQLLTFIHVESELRFAEEQNGPERYRARLAGHHLYYTNEANRQGIAFVVELDKRSGRITVIGAR